MSPSTCACSYREGTFCFFRCSPMSRATVVDGPPTGWGERRRISGLFAAMQGWPPGCNSMMHGTKLRAS